MKNKLTINPKLLLMILTSSKTMIVCLLLFPINKKARNTKKVTGNKKFLRETKEMDRNG
jgi:hypothetical protein